ncbi:MAG: DUF421 domain-containing protein [Lachnospiraceae bacterium]|nr:DUF421 domain-containing protein [Lachnospiraceae bacterium]
MDALNIILTTVWSVVTLFIMAKLMGHKQVAELDFFDYITGITIGSIAAEMATDLEEPWKPFIAMVVYGLIAVGLSVLTDKVARLRKYVDGTPTILMDNGKLYRDNMKKAKIDLSEFMVMCRQQGYFNLNEIQTAVFEYNGRLSILPVSMNRPATPADMNLTPAPEYICTEVIMDGRVLEGNLKKMELDLNWLREQIKAQGYHDVKEIYLGVCDVNRQLSLYAVK